MRAVAMGTQLPRTLRGNRGAVAVDDLPKFQIGNSGRGRSLESLYGYPTDAQPEGAGHGMFEAVRMIEALRQQPYTPANGAQYQGEFGRRLQQVARLIKADVGVEVAFVDIGGWDHHATRQHAAHQPAQPVRRRHWPRSRATWATAWRTSSSSPCRSSGARLRGERQRRHRPRAWRRDDGAGRSGARRLVSTARWPGLEPEQLFEKRDLAVTTDFRDVLGELVAGHLKQPVDRVFPGFTTGPAMGLLRA